ncbi:MAG: NTP transferase domain-containing protein [Syntrophomonadaceae bacterium]|nr:NTP transferase domain-containing protein [Syntrophomonadaceae bacterium]
MISAILAGGKGLRLWPESRQARPKQLCKFINNKSMLDHTIDRLIAIGSQRIIIITSDDLLPDIENLVKKRSDAESIEILGEPLGKNTAPAVGLVLAKLYHENQDEILGIFPADHHVLDIGAFKESIGLAMRAAEQHHLVTVGISPDRPETGFGYIEKTKWEIGEIPGAFQVYSFYEKPDMETAKEYVASGQHMWNAGIYIGKVSTLIEEFKRYLPEIYEKITKGYEEYIKSYPQLPNISLDYGIAEKSERMAVVPADFGWCDLGSWNAMAELYKPDNMANICAGNDIIAVESNNCIAKQSEKTLILFGVKDLLVIETDDVILVSDRNKAQNIRDLVENLEQQKRYDLL